MVFCLFMMTLTNGNRTQKALNDLLREDELGNENLRLFILQETYIPPHEKEFLFRRQAGHVHIHEQWHSNSVMGVITPNNKHKKFIVEQKICEPDTF